MKLFKYIIMSLFIVLSISNTSEATEVVINKKTASILKKLDLDQIWFFTYYEFNLLRTEQKDDFYKNILKISESNTVLKDIIKSKNEESLKKFLVPANSWDLIEIKINNQCKDEKNYKACLEIASVRNDILDKYRAHK